MTEQERAGAAAHRTGPDEIRTAAKQTDRSQVTARGALRVASMTVPAVDVVPAEVRLSDGLLAVLHALGATDLGVALSLLHPADPYLCAARAAVDVADLRHGALRARTEVSHDVAAGVLAAGMSTEPIRPLQQPPVPVRCDACHRSGAQLRTASGRWVWEAPDVAAGGAA